jgi:hypothetical protein
MNSHATILLSILSFARVFAADNPDAVVRFSNNDQLTGSFHSLSEDLLVWNSPALEKPTSFFLKNVIDLTLPATQVLNLESPEATLKLTNGDQVCGKLTSVTDQEIALDTRFADRMHFNRLMVASVQISPQSTFVYAGPTGLDGWKQSNDKPAWSYRRLAFRSDGPGGIARDHLLDDQCAISFDLAWRGDALGFKLVAFSDDPSSSSAQTGYEIAFQRGSIYLRNCNTQNFLGSTNAQALMDNDIVHIEIRASIKSGKVCLSVNNRLLEVWTDPDVAKGRFGSCLHLVATTPSPVRISRIGVAPWDGFIDRLPEPRVAIGRLLGGQFGAQPMDADPSSDPAPHEKPSEGRMELANGDSLKGEVTSIHEGTIALKTPLGDVRLPVDRLRSLALKKIELERCILRNGDIRAWFPDGSSIVFRLESVTDDVLTGSSQNFGTASFKLSAFSRIEFNIHDPQFENIRTMDDW